MAVRTQPSLIRDPLKHLVKLEKIYGTIVNDSLAPSVDLVIFMSLFITSVLTRNTKSI
jgi:hypothetical protein